MAPHFSRVFIGFGWVGGAVLDPVYMGDVEVPEPEFLFKAFTAY